MTEMVEEVRARVKRLAIEDQGTSGKIASENKALEEFEKFVEFMGELKCEFFSPAELLSAFQSFIFNDDHAFDALLERKIGDRVGSPGREKMVHETDSKEPVVVTLPDEEDLF